MSLTELLKLLQQHQIQIGLNGDELKVSAAKGVMTPALMQLLKDNKARLLSWAREQAEQNHSTTIPRLDRDQDFPLGLNQQRLWAMHKLHSEAASYNMPMAVKLDGQLSINKLSDAIQALIDRHDVFRARMFENAEGNVRQRILSPGDPDTDLTLNIIECEASELTQHLQQSALQPFQLSKQALFRAQLFKTADQQHALLFNMHHIIGDRVSIENLLQELAMLFTQQQAELQSAIFEPLAFDFADFAAWQEALVAQGKLEQQIDFWQQQLSGAPALLQLPTDAVRSKQTQFAKANTYNLKLPEALVERAKALAIKQSLTPFTLFFAAQQILFNKLSQQNDMVTGLPIAGRHHNGTQKLIGYFVNSLAIRSRFENNPSVSDFLQQCKSNILQAFEHQDAPLNDIIERLKLGQSDLHNALIQYGFNFISQQVDTSQFDQLKLGDVRISPIALDDSEAKFDQIWSLTDQAFIHANSMQLSIEYNTALFKQETVSWFAELYTHTLQQLCEVDLQQPIGSFEILPIAFMPERLLLANNFEAITPLSPMQRDLYVDSLLAPDSTRNIIGYVHHTHQTIEPERLALCLAILPRYFSSLRLRIVRSERLFPKAAGLEPAYGCILPIDAAPALPLTQLSLDSHLSEQDAAEACVNICRQSYRFTEQSLAEQPLMQLSLVEHHGKHSICFSTHHCALDGVGMQTFAQQLSHCYSFLAQHEIHSIEQALKADSELKSLFISDSYQAEIEYKRHHIDQAQGIDFWQDKAQSVEALPDSFGGFNIATDEDSAASTTENHYQFLSLKLNRQHSEAIENFCATHKLSLTDYFKTCFALCLASQHFQRQAFYFLEAVAGR